MEANLISTVDPTRGVIFDIPEIRDEESAALERIEQLRKELRFYVGEPRRWVGNVARVLRARAIQGSNSIEGFNVSVEDAVAAIDGDEPVEAERANWLAVSGYRRAMTYVLQLASDPHFAYSAETIRGLHFMMTEYDLNSGPGLWRPGAIWIRNDATGDVVYEGPDADEIGGLIAALIGQLHKQDDRPMIRGAMAHLNLAMIHPFRDGNGRMARCLQTLVLAREAILAPEWSSIEEYLGRNTEDYYKVLGEVGRGGWHPENDARAWVRFCLKAHFTQASSVLRRVRESEAIWVEVDKIRENSHLHERTLPTLFDATIGFRVRNASHRANVAAFEPDEISNQVATNDLRTLVDLGLLERRGAKRGTSYVATKQLAEIRERAQANRTPIDASAIFEV